MDAVDTESNIQGDKREPLKLTKFVYLQGFLTCMSSLNVGYDIGIIATSIIYMDQDIGVSNNEIQLIVSIANFFALFGGILGGHLADRFGRKPVILFTSILSCIAVILMSVTSNIYLIYLSRAMNGTSFGIALAITPLYMAEVSPPSIRGKLVSLTEMFNSLGMIIGYIIGLLFNAFNADPSIAWRLMIASGAIISLILFFAMIFMPESPRWLLQHGYEVKAKNSLIKTYGKDNIKIIEFILKEMTESNTQLLNEHMKTSSVSNISNISNNNNNSTADNAKDGQDEKDESVQSNGDADSSSNGFYTSWRYIVCCCFYNFNNNNNNDSGNSVQQSLFIGIPNAIFQQLSAIEIFIYYAPEILKNIGLNQNQVFLYTVITVGIPKFAMLILVQFVIDKIGRKPLLLGSSLLMAISIGVFGLILQFDNEINNSNYILLIMMTFATGSFSLGYGPITWVLNSEIFPLNIRPKAMGYCTLLNRLTATIVTLTFFSLQNVMSDYGPFYLYFFIGIFISMFIFFKIPETKNKTLEEITNDYL